MNTEAYEAMKPACENFVNKVETGRARSKNSYEEMKKALLLAKENDALDLVIGTPFEQAVKLVDQLDSEQITDLFSGHCKYCGDKDPSCQCWNDE